MDKQKLEHQTLPLDFQIGAQNFSLISQKQIADILVCFWVWGKIDFQNFYQKNKHGQWQWQETKLVRKDQLYSFAGKTHSGLIFEETQWKKGDEVLFLELPSGFEEFLPQIAQLIVKKLALGSEIIITKENPVALDAKTYTTTKIF